MLRIVAFCIGLMVTLPAAWADAYKDCAQMQYPDLSIRACSAIIAKGPLKQNLANAYLNRGNAYDAKGDHDHAITDYSRAIELEPKNAYAYNGRAYAYFKAGKAAQGLPDAERSLELRPDDANTLETRGEIFETMGRREEATADYRRALSKDPSLQDSKDGLKRLGASP